ncbi:MAG: bifunctional 5,10-methylenetetrahydrofolate dehydrogenase/5,10-methenyltetrahydrofolate cyclohydrolase [Patescibacteria group bacterium]
MHILNGKIIAAAMDSAMREQVAALPFAPTLHCILVGSDPASVLYLRRKGEAADRLGIQFALHHLPATVSAAVVADTIASLNKEPGGLILQLPLPLALRPSTDALVTAIDPQHDADGLTDANRQRVLRAEPDAFLPAPVGAAIALLQTVDGIVPVATLLPFSSNYRPFWVPVRFVNKSAVVVSNGDFFGSTLCSVLTQAGMHARVIRSDAKDLAEILAGAAVVVTAVGNPQFLRGSQFALGSTIIDVGTTLVDGKTIGDVLWDETLQSVGAATPVPGGVGPVTVAMLYANLIRLCRAQRS